MEKRSFAIILAAGKGTRMQSEIPKQFLQFGNHPLIWYSLKAFEESEIDEMVLVTDETNISWCEENFLNTGEFKKLKHIITGGSERYESVFKGLKFYSDFPMQNICGLDKETGVSQCSQPKKAEEPLSFSHVLIHDGARPFTTPEMINDMLEKLQTEKACIFGVPVKDTIKEADQNGYVTATPDRKKLWQIQTPQGFSYPELLSAYERVLRREFNSDKEKKYSGEENNSVKMRKCSDKSDFNPESSTNGINKITDDSMVWESVYKEPVFIMEGSYRNIKITTPEDLVVGKGFLDTL